MMSKYLFSKSCRLVVWKGKHTFTIKRSLRDFPSGPVVKNSPSNAGDMGSAPGQGTKIPACHRAAKP